MHCHYIGDLVEDKGPEGGRPGGKIRVEASKAPMKPPEVLMYSTSSCPYCGMAREYFTSKGIAYQDFDVDADTQKAREMVAISGQGAVPVIIINKRVIIGFDKPLIEDALTRPPPARRETLVSNLTFDIFDRH